MRRPFAHLSASAMALVVMCATATAQPTARDASDALNDKVRANAEAVAARNRAKLEKFEAETADFEAKKAADQTAYAASLAAFQAEVDAQARKYAAQKAEWKARVHACVNGDRARCGR
jgi:hypothetical protein